MQPVIWECFVLDFKDTRDYLTKILEWKQVKKTKVKCLVDTGASQSIIFEHIVRDLEKVELGFTYVQGVCDKPAKFRVVLLGVAILVDNEPVVSIHRVLIPAEKKVEEKLLQALKPHGAEAILGRLSLDDLSIGIEPKTNKPIKLPILII